MTAAEDRRGSTRAADGIDTFITGDAPHWAAIAAEELGINLLLAGHYATETFGVKPWRLISRKNSGLIGNSSVCQRDSEITVLPKTCSLL
jgi:putative NIF3 family GTP cyclohydrolase 1 type 2